MFNEPGTRKKDSVLGFQVSEVGVLRKIQQRFSKLTNSSHSKQFNRIFLRSENIALSSLLT